MAAFSAGEADILVATTVIEVGVDVPNATLMVMKTPTALVSLSSTSSAVVWAAARQNPTAYCSLPTVPARPVSG